MAIFNSHVNLSEGNSKLQLLIRHRMKHSTGVLALLAMGPPLILQRYPKQPPKVNAKKLESRKKGKHHEVPYWFHLQ